MSDAETIIRYDGPALAGHEIDVQELAPALLALADMVQFTNRRFNGESTTMKVTVRADAKQQCFMLHIHLAQSILESAKHLFGTDEYKTAKEIAEFLDLIFPVGPPAGVFILWKFLAKRKQRTPASELEVQQHGGTTVLIDVHGDGNSITVPTQVYQLASDPQMIKLGKRVMAPLERPGYDTLAFQNAGTPVVEIDKTEAGVFRTMPATEAAVDPSPLEDEERTPIRARVMVKTQRNEGKAQWELKWAARAEWASIDDLAWLEEFQAGRVPHPIPLYLDVQMDMVTSRTNPDAPARFHVLKVLGALPNGAGIQEPLL